MDMDSDIRFRYSTTSWLVICYNHIPCISYMAIHIQFLRNYILISLETLWIIILIKQLTN